VLYFEGKNVIQRLLSKTGGVARCCFSWLSTVAYFTAGRVTSHVLPPHTADTDSSVLYHINDCKQHR